MQGSAKTGSDKYDLQYLERQVHNLSRLVEINNIINSTLDMARLLTLIMEIIKDIMDAEASTLLLYEESSRDLVFKVALSDVGRELQERYRVKVGQGIAGWVAEHRNTVYINDVYNDPRFDPNFDRNTGFKTRSMLCAPLLFKGKLLGVIQAINPVNRPGFDDDDVVLFNAFATQCVLAVQNAIFFQNALDEERIKNELASAHAIQASLLPEINVRRGRLRVAAKSISAREVGGEFYDIFYFDDNSVAIALGDLHRKGMPGALYASIASGVVKALSRLRGDNPALILRRVHETLKDHLDSSVYLSLFYGMVRGDARSLQFANAGVAYPILVRGGVSRYLRFAGNFEEKSPKNIRVELQLGDFFVIITDGVINLKNRRGQLLGLNRVMKEIESGMATPEDIIQALLQLMDEFTDGLERREDISIIAFKAE